MKKATFIAVGLIFLVSFQAKSQKLKSGVITEGLIDIIIIDTTETSLADKVYLKKVFNGLPPTKIFV